MYIYVLAFIKLLSEEKLTDRLIDLEHTSFSMLHAESRNGPGMTLYLHAKQKIREEKSLRDEARLII